MSVSNFLRGVRTNMIGNAAYAQGIRNLAQQSLHELPASELYAVLWAMYDSNGLYDTLAQLAHRQNVWAPALKALRNPTSRVCEFHAAKLLAGPLEITTDNQALPSAIEQVWKWSNLTTSATVMSRTLAITGDLFLKVAKPLERERVYFQRIEPEYVVDFDVDDRDNLVWIRVDMPMSERGRDGKSSDYLHVEIWSKADGNYRRWKITDPTIRLHPVDELQDVSKLGTPAEEIALDAMGAGLDFVPFVHAKFKDTGQARGQAAIMPAYEKIHEANLQATRLSQMLFRHNNVTQAIQSAGRDASGRPVPAPAVGAPTSTDGDTVMFGDDPLLRLPAGWELVQLVPNLDYASALAILNAQLAEIQEDLPELAYYSLRAQGGDLSGRAVRMLLGDAADRAIEARANLEAVLVRADQMALTIGASAGLFPDLGGTYQDGAFDHRFTPREIFPTSGIEDAQEELARAQAFGAWRAAGLPVVTSLERLGLSGDELQAVAQAMVTEAGPPETQGQQ